MTPMRKDQTLSDSGLLWIDPETHQVLRMKANGGTEPSRCIYASGIMTRVQIQDASRALGCIPSAAMVAEQWTELL